MGTERSPERRKRDAKRRKRAADARTWGGEVVVRRVDEPAPVEPPPMPSRRA